LRNASTNLKPYHFFANDKCTNDKCADYVFANDIQPNFGTFQSPLEVAITSAH
jgi:hypothetical protein